MKIKRVEHIAIAVNSLKQSMDLLQNTFGIPLEYEEQIGATRLAMLPVGETYIELLESKAPESGINQWIAEKGEGLFHICFEVEDIDGALAELKAKGVGCATRRRGSAMAARASRSSIRHQPATC